MQQFLLSVVAAPAYGLSVADAETDVAAANVVKRFGEWHPSMPFLVPFDAKDVANLIRMMTVAGGA